MHKGTVYNARWTPDGRGLVTCGSDSNINLLTTNDLQLIRTFRGHTDEVGEITFSRDGSLFASSSSDSTVRVWDLARGAVVAVLEGHTDWVISACFSPNADFLASLSSSESTGLCLWHCGDWAPVVTCPQSRGHLRGGLAFHPSQPLLAVKNQEFLRVDCYRLDYSLLNGAAADVGSRRYGNAKVVLLGDTGVGKSGLGLVLSGQPYQPTDSTHGRNVWTLTPRKSRFPAGARRPGRCCCGTSPGSPVTGSSISFT